MYSVGQGIGRNVEEAPLWLTKAAQAGDPRAQYATGYPYETEDAIRDNEAALNWYRRAADQGTFTGSKAADSSPFVLPLVDREVNVSI
jgi:hypothetical protein